MFNSINLFYTYTAIHAQSSATFFHAAFNAFDNNLSTTTNSKSLISITFLVRSGHSACYELHIYMTYLRHLNLTLTLTLWQHCPICVGNEYSARKRWRGYRRFLVIRLCHKIMFTNSTKTNSDKALRTNTDHQRQLMSNTLIKSKILCSKTAD